jgi:ribosomal protein S9
VRDLRRPERKKCNWREARAKNRFHARGGKIVRYRAI